MARSDATYIPEYELIREFPEDRDEKGTTSSKANASAPFEAPQPLPPENEEDSQFLRTTRRIPVRRGPLARRKRLRLALIVGGCLLLLVAVIYSLRQYAEHNSRFRIESSDNIEITGLKRVSRGDVLDVLGADIGRNLFFVPMEERQRQLAQIPWVESASLMRLLPNRLRIEVRERTPIAFVQTGSRVSFIDANGAIMARPRGSGKYSFPVVIGLGESDPLSVRAARMKIYRAFVGALDADGANRSHDVSEIDLSDPQDIKAEVADPAGTVLVHFGSSDFLARFQTYMAHIPEWRQQFSRIASVDMRSERQIVLTPGPGGGSPTTIREVPTHGE